jgi:hypothetical protein
MVNLIRVKLVDFVDLYISIRYQELLINAKAENEFSKAEKKSLISLPLTV